MVDNGTTTSLAGENQQSGAQAAQGLPSQNSGTYGYLVTTAPGPNDLNFAVGLSVDDATQANITPANNTTTNKRYSLLTAASVSTDSGTSAIIIGQKNITAASGIPVNVNHGRYNFTAEATAFSGLGDRSSIQLDAKQNGLSSGVKYFQMVGFYVTGNVEESFIVTVTPAPSTTVNPNTGHLLINTFVSSAWVS